MHITRDLAGLIAQVYPAIMIALLVEGRLPVVAPSVRPFFRTLHWIRFLAISGATTSTFFCLYVYGADAPSSGVDVIVTGSGVLLFLALVFMTGTVLERQRSEAFVKFPGEEKAHLARRDSE